MQERKIPLHGWLRNTAAVTACSLSIREALEETIREALEERGIVNGQVADPEKLDNALFIQQVMSDVEQIIAAETEQPSEVFISDEEYDAVRRPTPQRTSYDPAAPV